MSRTSGAVIGSAPIAFIDRTPPTAAASPVSVEVISGYEEFLALEPLWDELIMEAEFHHPFVERPWIRTWWECLGGCLLLFAKPLPSRRSHRPPSHPLQAKPPKGEA